ncbi:hypothetical protein WOLCODRAFT_153539 [Wolfiporia cocos MD-104 SS10]|uniref:Ribosomal RNA-processing protein 17 n=1 Tax=Wolfiporia cocos (strain MD-104) TaxID=742152 RepID=A0A2H3JX65_WOLCO|nr:hypothetical protein WOLCODRAFT_153539 [Wolfiporia cocos MD-104 SS10]
MAPSNLAVLTNSHRVVAAKRRAKKEQIKEVVFDDNARREYLTGFHKRKLEKKEAAKKKAQEKERLERLEARREKRQLLAERAARNAADAERLYGGIVDDKDNDQEWSEIAGSSGSADEGKGAEKEEEYEYEEQVATVTVVEDFDPDTLLHGPSIPRNPQNDNEEAASKLLTGAEITGVRAPRENPQKVESQGKSTAKSKAKVAVKSKDIKYQTNAARKADRLKQRRRKKEKAERAGGKASRKSGGGRKKR